MCFDSAMILGYTLYYELSLRTLAQHLNINNLLVT